MTEQELRDWIRLTATTGLGNTSIRRLLARFGLPGQILAQPSSSLETVISANQAKALLQPSAEMHSLQTRTWEWLNDAPPPLQHRILVLGNDDYPSRLLDIADPPVLLYVIGHSPFFSTGSTDGRLLRWPEKAIAIVGSRNPTEQGVRNAQSFARHLAQQEVCIVSGMALGIDTAAHHGALYDDTAPTAQPATIAIIGTGVDRVYPKANHALAQKIAAHGLIVSEYHLGTPPLAANFPKRNRLISGLSLGTLVVEAAAESGSLVTARIASEQGKEVFAIPGSIHSPQSKGCHALIRQGAKLVESVTDIAEELPHLLAPTAPAVDVKSSSSAEVSQINGGNNALLNALGYEPVDIDMLIDRTGIDIATLQSQLLELELQGLVARLPGGQLQRLVQG